MYPASTEVHYDQNDDWTLMMAVLPLLANKYNIF